MKEMQSYIHLANGRKVIETSTSRSLVSYEGKSDLENLDFRGLFVFEDSFLSPGQNMVIAAETHCLCLILPLVGGAEFPNLEHSPIVAPGEFFLIKLSQKENFSIQNPFDNEHVNFLKVLLSTQFFCFENKFLIKQFYLDASPNKLVLMSESFGNESFIGNFESRAEGQINSDENFNSFVFVVSGSFEVNGMLLHDRDAASCFNIKTLDFESLSLQSIILILKEKS
jgi:quercetin 2,3-dioxygenase